MAGSRYPHTLTYTTPESGGEYDPETGEYTPVVPGEEILIECRATPNGSGKTITGKGGVNQEYSYDLGFPLGTLKIPENTLVKIWGVDDELLHEGKVIQYQPGVYSIRGWAV